MTTGNGNKGKEMMEKTKEIATKAAEKTKEVAHKVGEKAKETYNNINQKDTDKVTDKAKQAGGNMKEAASGAYQTGKNAYEKADKKDGV